MRKEFLDECKEVVFDALDEFIEQHFDSTADLVDLLSRWVVDDLIWYNQGAFARENYSYELNDAFSRNPWLGEEHIIKVGPFSDEFALNVYRCALDDMCRFMMDSILSNIVEEDVGFTLDNNMLIKVGSELDDWDQYPYCDWRYYYYSEFDDDYFCSKAHTRVERVKEQEVHRKEPDIVTEAKSKLGEDWDKSKQSEKEDPSQGARQRL